ncbi:MAG: hypothetical protein ACXQTP_03795 [Candidatus Methanofastidiosia archaeon]
MKEHILDSILQIRKEIGAINRIPEITRITKSDDSLTIECEDRSDKSIVIGSGGWVVGKLGQQLGVGNITVESRLDNILHVKRLIASFREVDKIANESFKTFARNFILKRKVKSFYAIVLGDESLWICGLMESVNSYPLLIHSEFIDKRVKEAYEKTRFVKVDMPSAPYEERLSAMLENALKLVRTENIKTVLGPFPFSIKLKKDVTLVNPQLFFDITSWKNKNYEKKKFKSNIFKMSDKNKVYRIIKTMDNIYLGLTEPSEGARVIYTCWPKEKFDFHFPEESYDPLIKRYRQKNFLKKAAIVSPPLHNAIKTYIEGKNSYCGLASLVALSGGVDSTASLYLSKQLGFKTYAATVDLPHINYKSLNDACKKLDVDLHMLPPSGDFDEVMLKAIKGDIHPCGRCHKIIEKTLIEYAIKQGFDVLIFGDMLSCGAQAITKIGELDILNLPAAFALTKVNMETISNVASSNVYGCPLLKKVHREFGHMRLYSIRRVLRELRANAIGRNFALTLTKDIMN